MATQQVTVEELLAKATKPSEDALKLHRFYRGKVETALKCIVRDLDDFAIWYTPGVAAVCRAIVQHPEAVYEYTNKGNLVAIISDGSRILGLGDIGPKAGLPVMEGKALLFKYLGGIDAVPILLDTKDPDEIIRIVKALQPSFGGVNLEDISQPKCFRILDTLRSEAEIPVWHDDQQGTATVTLAGLINALKIVGKKLDEVRVAFVGMGASNVACARLLFAAGVNPALAICVDSQGILHKDRTDIYQRRHEWVHKWRYCEITNAEGRRGGIPEAVEAMDVLIAYSKPGPGSIKPEWVARMAKDAIVFAGANPIPEIWPWEAKEAGARIVATGRSDFPNQVNNSLGFPGIFRGALDVHARTITDEMCHAAALTLAKMAEEQGLREDHILPTMEDWEVFAREAVAVGLKAQEQGVASKLWSEEDLYNHAINVIKHARDVTQTLMKEGFIPAPPE